MRVALISDIHGNLVSLEAVLSDTEGVDRIVCLGDVAATGPRPCETIERLMEFDFPTVMGNADEDLLRPVSAAKASEDARRVHDIDRWCAGRLSEKHLDHIRTFRETVDSSIEGGRSMLCFHGSPKSNTDIVLSTTPDEELGGMISGHTADIMAGGHTHVQMMRRFENVVLVNPGSVGLPVDGAHNPPWAEYAIISSGAGSSSVEMRRVPVDVRKVRRAALESGMPHSEWWASGWRE
ncbi:MAG: metallophosphoesterase family protein [Rubrobacteraceae bacterium]